MSLTYARQTGTSTVTNGAFLTAFSFNMDTSAASGTTFYELTYKYTTASTGMLASQELRIRVDGVEVAKFPQKSPSNDFMRISLTPAVHTITFDHRLSTYTAGATGKISDINMALDKIDVSI